MNFYDQLIRFLEQSKTNELAVNTYPSDYSNLQMVVSFGKGNPARIPWISFLQPPNRTNKGIYPVFLFYKNEKLLVLAFGVSETNDPEIEWEVNEQTIHDYFINRFRYRPYRYGASMVFKTYDLNSPLNADEVERDLNEIIEIYKSTLNKLLLSSDADLPEIKMVNETKGYLNGFKNDLKSSGLILIDSTVNRFLSALLSKRFLILTGLSGSGKTKLAQAFVKWISPSKEHYELIPVGADWTNREPLLGYADALDKESYARPESGVLDLLLRAEKDSTHPFSSFSMR